MGRKKGQKNKKKETEGKQEEAPTVREDQTPPAPASSGDIPESQDTKNITAKKKPKKEKKVADQPTSSTENSESQKSADTQSSTSINQDQGPKSKADTKSKRQKPPIESENKQQEQKTSLKSHTAVSEESGSTVQSSSNNKQGAKKGKRQKSSKKEESKTDIIESAKTDVLEQEEPFEKNKTKLITHEQPCDEGDEYERTDFPSLEFTTQQNRKKRKQKKGQSFSVVEASQSQETVTVTRSRGQIKQPDIQNNKQEKGTGDSGTTLQAEEFPILDPKTNKKAARKKRTPINQEDKKKSQESGLVEGFSQLQISTDNVTAKTQLAPPIQKRVVKQAQAGECFELTIPHRKTRSGTKGRPILIETNHLALYFKKLDRAVHYDVSITPSTPKKLLRQVMEEFRNQYYNNRYPAFDGTKNLYSSGELPFGQQIAKDITLSEDEQSKSFKVVIKFANFVDLTPLKKFMTANPDGIHHMVTPQEVIQCLDIVLRSAPALTCLPVGRSYFTPPKDQILSLGGGMEMYYGFYQSAVIGWKPFLNIDVAHKAFPTRQNVIDLIMEMGDLQRNELQKPLQRNHEDEVNRFIRTLKVRYEIPGKPATRREYKVNGLEKSAREATFKPENGSEITVEKYFSQEKKVVLKYPYMPCLWVGNKDRVPHILLPAEFCTIVEGQVINRKMSEKLTSAMIKQAATSTKVRKEKIMSAVRKARFNQDPCVREFGIGVSDEFLKINARVLDPPTLTYNGRTIVKPAQGAWRPSKFYNGISLTQWTVVNLDRSMRMEPLEEMVKIMCAQASTVGMQIAQPERPFQTLQPRYKKELQELEELFKKKKSLQLIVVVVPNTGPLYSYVKQAAELLVGCLTQCIRSYTVNKINISTVVNILQKVNAKLEGINHILNDRMDWMRRPYMIMGADVTHPSPDAKDKPSVAAVTASYDVGAFKYNICWRLQPPKVEIIEDLENITREQLLYFNSSTKHRPERIIFFRDGVSEGQFPYVLNTEIQAIRRACTCLQPDGSYKPKITFLVVQKRHHTRFFPINPQDASKDKNLNVPVGTCVDTEITHPTALDFCLVSHASIQGVARPTKYRVLWDDADMSEDDLEQLAYYFCHMFSRCTRSVSYPAPTYYAHLAAARIMAYCETGKLNMNNLRQEQERLSIKHSIIKGRPMFFV